MAVSESEFRNALSRFASGVSVVTTRDAAGKAYGITVSAFCSVSLSPRLVLICIERETPSHHAFTESGFFVVNILDETQEHLSERFATPADDKFGEIEFRPGIAGIPVLKTALASLECRLHEIHNGGDHSIFVGHVEAATLGHGKPLTYFRGRYGAIPVE